MALSSRKLQLLSLSAPPLLALLFLSTTVLEVSGTSNISSAYHGASSSASSSHGAAAAADAAAAPSWGRSLSLTTASQKSVFSLDRYGARGDGKHDDTPALARAWKAACSSSRPAVVVLVPRGKRYLLKPVSLAGPCKSAGGVTVAVQGTLVASPNRADWGDDDKKRKHWVVFRAVSKLTVNGGGAVDGNGHKWWQHSCKINKALPCKEAPTALSFHYCTNLRVEDLKIVNSQQIHMSVEDCTNVRLTRLSITAPGTSPNTDGIHVTRSKDVQVTNCKIKTGDDCMSIENGTHNLLLVVCGPGHGISIGSLGDDNSRAEVSGITVDTVQFYGTTNGARIKTYQGGSGYAKDIIFQNIIMDSVKNPIIVDQNYCDKAKPCKAQGSAVEVSNVVFRNIRGTSITKEAIKLNCSRNVPCHDITLQNIDLKMEGGKGAAKSICQNAKWRKSGTVLPQPCTSKN